MRCANERVVIESIQIRRSPQIRVALNGLTNWATSHRCHSPFRARIIANLSLCGGTCALRNLAQWQTFTNIYARVFVPLVTSSLWIDELVGFSPSVTFYAAAYFTASQAGLRLQGTVAIALALWPTGASRVRCQAPSIWPNCINALFVILLEHRSSPLPAAR